MGLRNILMAALLAASTFACSGEEEPPGPACEMECTGETICVDTQCEQVFDRDYHVHLYTFPIGRLPCSGPECPSPQVSVYFGEVPDPIMHGRDLRDAEIGVTKGSSLIVDLESEQCQFELTAERLRTGHVTCRSSNAGATVLLDPMPM